MGSLLPDGGSVRNGGCGSELAALCAADEGRQARLARMLRQEIMQPLTALHMDVVSMRQHFGDPAGLDARLAQSAHVLQQVLARMWRLGSELGAFVLEDLGLPAAMELLADAYAEDTGFSCVLEVPHDLRLDRCGAIGLYRIAQEWLEHLAVAARGVRLRLAPDGPEIVLMLEATVSDQRAALYPLVPSALPARVRAAGGVLACSQLAPGHVRIEVRVPSQKSTSG